VLEQFWNITLYLQIGTVPLSSTVGRVENTTFGLNFSEERETSGLIWRSKMVVHCQGRVNASAFDNFRDILTPPKNGRMHDIYKVLLNLAPTHSHVSCSRLKDRLGGDR
jgi:hypothetical protein